MTTVIIGRKKELVDLRNGVVSQQSGHRLRQNRDIALLYGDGGASLTICDN